MTITHRGYTATQARNHHIMIFDQDGKMVSHIDCSHPLNEEGLKAEVDTILSIMEEFKDGKMDGAADAMI